LADKEKRATYGIPQKKISCRDKNQKRRFGVHNWEIVVHCGKIVLVDYQTPAPEMQGRLVLFCCELTGQQI
jgi:hypothetical protein